MAWVFLESRDMYILSLWACQPSCTAPVTVGTLHVYENATQCFLFCMWLWLPCTSSLQTEPEKIATPEAKNEKRAPEPEVSYGSHRTAANLPALLLNFCTGKHEYVSCIIFRKALTKAWKLLTLLLFQQFCKKLVVVLSRCRLYWIWQQSRPLIFAIMNDTKQL